ncbi:cell division protein ZapD [Inhella inkyongensis]|uniref:Cell division protein ZapD n=1 Tax=Inhella inkyongensis TaxID=392593 RepID=A0A840S2L6_9BURK|nr:cell division protein ZapD [Inhella inkyongensis]MBB5203326.1 cell division protein ZapD [Inhella inkyongensis]
MLLYEFPLNETLRTLLRLEHLFGRLGQLAARDTPLDHHFALTTLFEVVEVGARSDLKSDLMKELERHKAQFNSYRGNPAVSEAALDDLIQRLDRAFQALHQMQGKPGAVLASNEMLNGLRSRIAIPGGTCEFDLPAYHAWQQQPCAVRQPQLMSWMDSVAPVAQAVDLLLSLLRKNGVPQMVAAQAGQYQQSLNAARAHQLLRLRIAPELGLIPEISGHRLMVSIRLLRESEGRLKPCRDDASFELCLCA